MELQVSGPVLGSTELEEGETDGAELKLQQARALAQVSAACTFSGKRLPTNLGLASPLLFLTPLWVPLSQGRV